MYFDCSDLLEKYLGALRGCLEIPVNQFYLFLFSGNKMVFGLFFPLSKRAVVYIVDTVRSDQMPTLTALFNAERNSKYKNYSYLIGINYIGIYFLIQFYEL